MKVVLNTVGSTGDTQPFIALGKGLQAAGHEVKALVARFHQERFESYGIPVHPCGPLITLEDVNEVLAEMMATSQPHKQLGILLEKAFLKDGDQYLADALEGVKGADIGISHHADFLGQEALVRSGIPRIGTALAPEVVPTGYAAPGPLPNISRFTNRLFWKMAAAVVGKVTRRARNFLEAHGGCHQDIQLFASFSKEHNFMAYSRHIAFVPPDLPKSFLVTGHWRLDESGYTPDAALADFLERHPRPVVVSLGSMGGTQGRELAARVIEGLKMAGYPAILQRGYAGLDSGQLPENMHFTDYVPHDFLFAHAGCVVHHCGAGTTHAVLRSGTVTVPVNFIADQPKWAQYMRKRGVATRAFRHDKLRSGSLAGRIREAMTDKEMQKRATALGALLSSEDGVSEAIQALELWYGGKFG